MTSALFIDPKGIYPKILKDCWDVEKDARKYQGPGPVVARPPCHLWVNMAAVNWKRYGKQRPAWYPGGCDGGCFLSALASVRRYGGVLEHPAFSHAWEFHGLRRPVEARWALSWHGEYVCEVWQSAYGHKARKRTWLLYYSPKGRDPFELRWCRSPGTHQIGWFDRNKPTLSKREANATPKAFAQELVRLANHSTL